MDKSERQSFSLDPLDDPLDENEDLENSKFPEILKKTWHIYSVSTMFNCSLQDDAKLKMYRKRLRELLSYKLPKENCSYTVELQVLEGLNAPSDTNNPQALMIEVVTKKLDKETTSYTGIMLSWRSMNVEHHFKDSLNLPILISRGTLGTMRVMKQLIAQIFDCTIIPLPINTDDLQWILIISLETFKENSDGELRIEYRIPGLPTYDEFIVKFPINETVKLMKRLIKRNKRELSLNEVKKVISYLQNQILVNSGVYLNRCVMHKIILPTIAMEGNKVKVLNANLLSALLTYFHDKAVQELYHKQSLTPLK